MNGQLYSQIHGEGPGHFEGAGSCSATRRRGFGEGVGHQLRRLDIERSAGSPLSLNLCAQSIRAVDCITTNRAMLELIVYRKPGESLEETCV
jgi:hypothetical protein